MIRLEDYLYEGDTIFIILKKYSDDLEKSAFENHNQIDLVHSRFLGQMFELLEHTEFLTSQSQRMREFYKYMAKQYPYLAFTFKGRIKSIIRAEEKFNRYVVDHTNAYYKQTGRFPKACEIKNTLECFRDLIAYRIVISLPKCRIEDPKNRKEEEIRLLYEIANTLPDFLQKHDFTLVKSNIETTPHSKDKIQSNWQKYYRDYVASPTSRGYQSLHLTVYDNQARCYVEVQLRSKQMDDNAEIGYANHLKYEEAQSSQTNQDTILSPEKCRYYDEAYDRLRSLEKLDLSKLDVNMFSAVDNRLINDGCGLFRGRQILPFEHLSRFQNGLYD